MKEKMFFAISVIIVFFILEFLDYAMRNNHGFQAIAKLFFY